MLEPLGNAPRDGSRSLITFSMRRSTAIAIALSLLVHVLLIVGLVQKRIDTGAPVARPGPLVARLQPPRPPAPAAQPEPPAATPATPAPPPRTPPPRRPPVITQPRPSPRAAPPPAVFPPPAPSPPDNNPGTDMAANMRARQAAREAREGREGVPGPAEAPASGGSGNEVALRNLQSLQKPGVSGIFTITRMGQREGEFTFNGWTTDARNSKRQFFVVDAGIGGNLELAMVREMIKLIRQYYKADFKFDSHRLGRVVTLSARAEDSSGLEDFLRLEFFGPPR